MLTTKNTGLVQGVPLEEDPTTVRVKVLRGFFHEGRAVNAGEEVTVKKGFATFLIQNNKAVAIPSVEVVSVETAPAPPPQPEQIEPQPEPLQVESEAEEQKPRRRRNQ